MAFSELGHRAERICRFDQLDARIFPTQVLDHRIALGNRQSLALELAQIGRTIRAFAGQQNVGVFQIGTTEVEGFLALRRRQ
ncbi:hypothetical protein D3C72_375150 [compost metagenome]